jgi:hypothetical protein
MGRMPARAGAAAAQRAPRSARHAGSFAPRAPPRFPQLHAPRRTRAHALQHLSTLAVVLFGCAAVLLGSRAPSVAALASSGATGATDDSLSLLGLPLLAARDALAQWSFDASSARGGAAANDASVFGSGGADGDVSDGFGALAFAPARAAAPLWAPGVSGAALFCSAEGSDAAAAGADSEAARLFGSAAALAPLDISPAALPSLTLAGWVAPGSLAALADNATDRFLCVDPTRLAELRSEICV